jgi:uncharacterized protein
MASTPTSMPRRVFKSLSRQRHTLKNRWFMRPFKAVVDHPVYWSLNRRSVTRALALGLFVAFIPLPIHIPVAAALAFLFRLNVPVAIAAVFITNPITMVPMFASAYWLGCQFLGVPVTQFHFEMTWQWVQTELFPIWKPFLAGCFLAGLFTAALGYTILGTLWQVILVLRYHERKRDSQAKKSAIAEKLGGQPPANSDSDH